MSTKKKLWITIASLSVAVVAIVGITLGVLAATQVTVNSNINVSYTSQEVAATMSATYKIAGAESGLSSATAQDMKVGGVAAGATSVAFTGEEATNGTDNVKALSPVGNITLTSANRWVLFTYNFTNDSEDHAIVATLTVTNTTEDNVTVEYSTDGTTWAAYADATKTVSIAASGTGVYYVRMHVTALKNDAAVATAHAWVLTQAQAQAQS